MNNKMILYIALLTFFPLAASEVKVCSNGNLEGYRIIGLQRFMLLDYSYGSYDAQRIDKNKKVLIVDKIVENGGSANVIVVEGCEHLSVETAKIIFYNRTVLKPKIEYFLSVYDTSVETNSEKKPFYIHLVKDKKDTKCTKVISLQFTKKQVEDLLYNESFYMSIPLMGVGIAGLVGIGSTGLALLIYYFNLC